MIDDVNAFSYAFEMQYTSSSTPILVDFLLTASFAVVQAASSSRAQCYNGWKSVASIYCDACVLLAGRNETSALKRASKSSAS